jgi:hypothetical protein
MSEHVIATEINDGKSHPPRRSRNHDSALKYMIQKLTGLKERPSYHSLRVVFLYQEHRTSRRKSANVGDLIMT